MTCRCFPPAAPHGSAIARKNTPNCCPTSRPAARPCRCLLPLSANRTKCPAAGTCMSPSCPALPKNSEAVRDGFKVDGLPNVDYVLTTQELVRMIKESNLVFDELQPEAVDMPFGTMTGAGVIFGVTGGVTEAVLRRLAYDKSSAARHAHCLHRRARHGRG